MKPKIYDDEGRHIKQEVRQKIESFEEKYAEDLTQEELEFLVYYSLAIADKKTYEYINNIELHCDTTRYSNIRTGNVVKFKGRKIVFTYAPRQKCYSIEYTIQNDIDELRDKLKFGMNIENIYPYALDMLFNNQSPAGALYILDHFVDGNLAFVKTQVTRDLKKRNKYGNRDVLYVREMVIEKWGKNLENIKVKNDKFIKEFQILIEQKRAPKAKVLQVKYKDFLTSKNNVFIEKDDNGDNFLQLNTQFDFRANGFVLNQVKHVWLVHETQLTAWIRSRIDTYELDGSGSISSYYEDDIYYKLNEFGGIIKVDQNPNIFTELIDEKVNEPEVIKYLKLKDLYLNVSENETTIINQFENHRYLKIELTKETPYAREYSIINKANDKVTINYFAKYDGLWIHSTLANKKVKQMIEVYELADKLSDEDEIV